MGSSICVSCYISRSIKEETKTQMGLFVYVSELQFGKVGPWTQFT